MSGELAGLLARARARDSEAIEALADLVEAQLLPTTARPRGGDPHAAERAQRDAALRQLAALVDADMPVDCLAHTLADPAAYAG